MTLSNQFQEQNEVLAILGTRHTLRIRVSVKHVHVTDIYIILWTCAFLKTNNNICDTLVILASGIFFANVTDRKQ